MKSVMNYTLNNPKFKL